MITLLVGNNSFERERALEALVREAGIEPERRDGSEVSQADMPEIFAGMSLFATHRLVVIRGLSAQKLLWNELESWLARMDDAVQVVLVEEALDKRTKTFKALQKLGVVREFPAWTERDTAQAAQWLKDEVAARTMTLTPALQRRLLERVGVDQWRLHYALEKLSVLEKVDQQLLDDVIDAQPEASSFALFEAALRGDSQTLLAHLRQLEHSDDPYRTMGLLSAQAFQLVAAGENAATALGMHPYAVGKLAPHAKRLGRDGVRQVVTLLAEADLRLKSTSSEPWTVIASVLLMIAGKISTK